MQYSTIIGIDSHAKKNEIAVILSGTGELIRKTLPADPFLMVAWIKEQGFPLPIRCMYESGPTGYPLARALNEAGIECMVCATSKLPSRKDRKKNDRIDAEWLARMLLSGSAKAVRIPVEEEEALRDLSRLRCEAVKDLARAKKRVSSFLLIKNVKHPQDMKRWSIRYKEWADNHEFPLECDTFIFRNKLAEVYHADERLDSIERKIDEMIASNPSLAERMARLQCIHGIGKVVAFILISEIVDFSRFNNGAAFASFVGLTPSEDSSGDRNKNGSITKTGNANVRTALVEAANCYFRKIKPRAAQNGSVDPIVRAHADKCTNRLKRRSDDLKKRGKAANKAKIAIARELAEWVYYIAVM